MADFKLYPPQREALLTEAHEILYGGAVGGGKSYLIRIYYLFIVMSKFV